MVLQRRGQQLPLERRCLLVELDDILLFGGLHKLETYRTQSRQEVTHYPQVLLLVVLQFDFHAFDAYSFVKPNEILKPVLSTLQPWK